MRLRRVRPYADAGYSRARAGRSFRYRDASGARLSTDEVERIRRLAVPPAWTEVWIAAVPNAHVQAIGVDAAGRRQYIYHPEWRARHDVEKFARMRELARALPAARARVTRELRRQGLHRERVLAAAFRLLDVAALRVGSDMYAQRYGSRGVTTLQRRHLTIDTGDSDGATVLLAFQGKGGLRFRVELDDADLVAVLTELAEGRPPSGLLFAWRDDSGGRHPIHAAELNAFLRGVTGVEVSAKDFRTLRGTVVAASALAAAGSPGTQRDRRAAVRVAVEAAAAALGNTPAVARASYIDPTVLERFESGVVLATDRRPESALLELLGE